MPALSGAALLVIDVQNAIDAAYHAADGPRNNLQAEANIARLLRAWRAAQRPVIHIRHDSTFPASAYRPGQAGNDFKREVAPIAGETVIPKQTNSAFIGTGLERCLRNAAIETLVVAGVATNNSVEATVRMAGNLGFTTYLVDDACFTFARRDYRGRLRTAEEVHDMSLANLDREYCSIASTDEILATVAFPEADAPVRSAEGMTPTIRPATAEDAALLSSLNADVQAIHAQAMPWWFKPPGPETFPPAAAGVLLAKPGNLVFIAEAGFEPVGYAYAEVVERPEDAFRYAYRMLYLHHLSVRSAWQRRGIGEALVEAVRAAAAERRITLVGLDIWSFNEGARAFFRRQGFATFNERMWSR